MNDTIAERLKAVRRSRGLTQEELAEKANASVSAITSYECGRRIPTAPTMLMLAQILSVSLEWLETGKGDMNEAITDQERIQRWVQNTIGDRDESVQKQILSAITTLSTAEWAALDIVLGAAKRILAEDQAPDQEPASASLEAAAAVLSRPEPSETDAAG